MNELYRWALGLRSLDFGQEGVEFGFAHPMAGWAWMLAALGAVWVAWWSYRRLEGGRIQRGLLSALRAALLLLIVLLLSGPRLTKPNETEERDWVLILTDRSASMRIKDVPPSPPSPSNPSPTPPSAPSASSAEGGAGERRTREAQLRAALDANKEVWKKLAEDREVVWLGFDAGAFDLAGPGADRRSAATEEAGAGGTGGAPELGEPAGRRTALGRSLEQALRRATARPVSGVVIFSDGRSIDEATRATLRRVQAERIPIFTVPLGSPEPVTDYSIRRADGPGSAFVDDFVPIDVELERLGGRRGPGAAPLKVQLIDSATGAVLDEREVDWTAGKRSGAAGEQGAPDGSGGQSGQGGQSGSGEPNGQGAANAGVGPAAAESARVTLTTRAGSVGRPSWVVRLAPGTTDLVEENNSAPVGIELIDRPLRVAYFDGYPRWEQRYIKNLLVRERSMRGASMLLASGRRFVQEGDDVMTSIPRTPEEWRQYDVVIMGDVRPELFTPEQLRQVRDRVAVEGAGLIWIGGEGGTPGAWLGTPLADLLPFVLSGGENAGLPVWSVPVTMSPSPLADRLGVLRLLPTPENGTWWPPELSDPTTGWSQFRWAQRIDPGVLKPTAEVLATVRDATAPPDSADATTSPVLVSMRFGAGRVLYLATDEIWRWRYGRGEVLSERFYLQMIRMLGRESLSRTGKLATLAVNPKRAEVDQPVRIALELIDQSLVDAAPASIRARIVREGAVGRVGSGSPEGAGNGNDGAAPVEIVLSPEGGREGGGGERRASTYAATWIASESGVYRVEIDDPLLAAVGERGTGGAGLLSAGAEVWLPDDELRRPETDHAALARLSDASEGSVLSAKDLKDLPSLLPNRKVRLAGEPDVQTLWDTPLALILVITLLTLEWVGRRLIRLA